MVKRKKRRRKAKLRILNVSMSNEEIGERIDGLDKRLKKLERRYGRRKR